MGDRAYKDNGEGFNEHFYLASALQRSKQDGLTVDRFGTSLRSIEK